mgnify:CR=1 FL=1
MSQTSESNKRIAKNTLLLYFRMIFIMVISLFTSRINLQSLGVENFGIYNVVGGVVAMFSILTGALGVATSRFITFELGKGNKEKLHKVFSSAVTVQILMSLVVVIIAEITGVWFLNNEMIIPQDRLYAANWVLQFSILSFVLTLINVPYNACIIAHEKMSAFAYITIYEVIMKLVIAYSVFVTPIDKLITYSALLLFLSFSTRLIYGIYCTKHFEECQYRFVFDKRMLKQIGGFAGWTMIGNLAWVGYSQGLNILLNLFFGPSVNAARGIAMQVNEKVSSFCTNFQMALNPQITKSYAVNDLNRMHTLIYASSKYSFFLLLFLSLPILIETESILYYWLGNYPEHTAWFVRLIFMVLMVEVVANPLTVGAQANGHIKKYQIIVGTILLMIVPLSYIALKMGYPPEAVFVVHLIIVILAQCVRVIMVKNMISMPISEYVKRVVLRIFAVVATSVVFPIILHLKLPNSLLCIMLTCLVSCISVLLSVYILGLTVVERNKINLKIIKYIKKR